MNMPPEELRLILINIENRLRKLEGNVEKVVEQKDTIPVSGIPYEVEIDCLLGEIVDGHWTPLRKENPRNEGNATSSE